MQTHANPVAQVAAPPTAADPEHLAGTFRSAMRRMAATVSIISTGHRGVRYGMTATAVTSVSMDPPSLLVCVNRNASIHDPVCESGRFCISLLSAGQDEHCHIFSGRKEGEARFDSGDWRTSDGIPYLAGAQANLFCTVEKQIVHGTHTILIGRVTHARIDDRVTPLLYLDGTLRGGLSKTD